MPGDIWHASAAPVLANGRIQIVSNNGVDNAVTIPAVVICARPTAGGGNTTPNLTFGQSQAAKGQTAVSDFVAIRSAFPSTFASPAAICKASQAKHRLPLVRRFAEDNQPVNGVSTAVGTGLVTTFRRVTGRVISVSNSTVSIERTKIPSQALQFQLNSDQLSGLAANQGQRLQGQLQHRHALQLRTSTAMST